MPDVAPELDHREIALVLLPGMDGTGELFHDFTAALGPSVHPIVISYPTDQALDYEQLERYVRARLPLDRPFVLLGESFSGPIAVSIAASNPPGLRALILCASFVTTPRPRLIKLRGLLNVLPFRLVPSALLSYALLGRFASTPLRKALEDMASRLSVVTLRARIRAVVGVDVRTLLGQVRVPVLYLRATEDRVVPPTASELIARVLPGTRIVAIEAPHLLLQAAPVVAARHVERFVRAVTAGS